MKTVTLQIEGMRCNGCALGVQGALKKLNQVKSVQVSFPDKTAELVCDEDAYDPKAIEAAVQGLGFRVKSGL